jgi:hypothetical protein
MKAFTHDGLRAKGHGGKMPAFSGRVMPVLTEGH